MNLKKKKKMLNKIFLYRKKSNSKFENNFYSFLLYFKIQKLNEVVCFSQTINLNYKQKN